MSPKPPVPSGNSEENVIHLDRSKVQHSSDPGDWNWPLLITIKTEVVAILAEFHPPQKQQAFCTSRIGFSYRIRFKRWCWGVGAENRIKQYLRLNNRKRKCFRLQVSASTILQETLARPPWCWSLPQSSLPARLQGQWFLKHQSLMIRLKGDSQNSSTSPFAICFKKKSTQLLISLKNWNWPKLLVKNSHPRGLLLHFHQACNNCWRRRLVSWWSNAMGYHSANRTQFLSQWKR